MFGIPELDKLIPQIPYKSIDKTYIKNLLRSFKITNITHDEEGRITNPYFNKRIVEETDKLLEKLDENMTALLMEKSQSEIRVATMDEHCKQYYLFLSLCFSIFNYISPKIEHGNIQKTALYAVAYNAHDYYKSILFSYMAGNIIAILLQFRILYEGFVVYFFLRAHPELSEPFEDHGKILTFKILEIHEELQQKDKDKKAELLEKYGPHFASNYGWTASVLTDPKERTLKKMAECLVGFHTDFIYSLASNFTHPNSLSILRRDIVDRKIIRNILMQSIDIIFNIISAFIVDMGCCEQKDEILLQNILFQLRSICFSQDINKSHQK